MLTHFTDSYMRHWGLSVDIFCWGYGAPHHLNFQGPQAKFEGSHHWNTLQILQFGGVHWALRQNFTRAPLYFQGPGGLISWPPRALGTRVMNQLTAPTLCLKNSYYLIWILSCNPYCSPSPRCQLCTCCCGYHMFGIMWPECIIITKIKPTYAIIGKLQCQAHEPFVKCAFDIQASVLISDPPSFDAFHVEHWHLCPPGIVRTMSRDIISKRPQNGSMH